MTIAVVLISLAHAVEQVRVRTSCLVAEGHVGSLVVNVGATHTGVSDSDEDIVAFEVLSLGLGLLDAGILGAFVNGEFNCHFGRVQRGKVDVDIHWRARWASVTTRKSRRFLSQPVEYVSSLADSTGTGAGWDFEYDVSL